MVLLYVLGVEVPALLELVFKEAVGEDWVIDDEDNEDNEGPPNISNVALRKPPLCNSS